MSDGGEREYEDKTKIMERVVRPMLAHRAPHNTLERAARIAHRATCSSALPLADGDLACPVVRAAGAGVAEQLRAMITLLNTTGMHALLGDTVVLEHRGTVVYACVCDDTTSDSGVCSIDLADVADDVSGVHTPAGVSWLQSAGRLVVCVFVIIMATTIKKAYF